MPPGIEGAIGRAETTDVVPVPEVTPGLRSVPVAEVRLDGGTQLRVSLREGTVAEYAESYRAREKLPPPVVFREAGGWWIGDGHQRFAAARRAGMESLSCEVRAGGRRDAILYAAGANASHGDRRTRADATNAVATLLRDEEWGRLSDREIARRCGVTHPTVARIRVDLTGKIYQSPLRTGSDGRTIDTSRIGSIPSRDGAGQPARPDVLPPDLDGPAHVRSRAMPPDDPPAPAERGRRGVIPADPAVRADEPGGGCEAAPPPGELADEEWLATLPARPHLAEDVRRRFDVAALLFRRTAPLRLEYARACQPLTERAREEARGHVDAWLSRHLGYLQADDPSCWRVCKGCFGTGRLGLFVGCAACRGDGYHL
jgi:ParB-like chromosome segregation protein Spo0J